jgi:hypothetical protein
MFTPGRCKKTRSGFCAADVTRGVSALGATSGEASAAGEAGTSGEGTAPDAPRDGSGAVEAGCTGISDDDSTVVGEDGSTALRVAWAAVSDDDCTAIGEDSAVSAGASAPGEARKKYVSPATPNAAMIAVPAIRFRRDPNVLDRLLGSGGWKESSSPITGQIASSRRTTNSAAVVPFGARGGGQRSSGGFSLPSAKAFSVGPYIGNIYACHGFLQFLTSGFCRIEGGPHYNVCSPQALAERMAPERPPNGTRTVYWWLVSRARVDERVRH